MDRGRGQGVRRRSLGDAALRLGQDTVARRRWKHSINAQSGRYDALLDRGRGRGQGVRRRSLGDAALRLGQYTVARRRWKHSINAQFLL